MLQDIIIFGKDGKKIASRNQILKETELAPGFLSAMSSFITSITQSRLSALEIGENKFIFHHFQDIIGAIIISKSDDKQVKNAKKILERLIKNIVNEGIDHAEEVLANYSISEI